MVMIAIVFLKLSNSWSWTLVYIVLATSSVFLIFLVDRSILRHLAIIIICGVFLALGRISIEKLKKGPENDRSTLASMVILSTLFIFLAASQGFYINFLVPLWLLMILYMTVVSIASYTYFTEFFKEKISQKNLLLYCGILGFAMAELAWITSFWSFGYLTMGVIVLICFYIQWDIIQSYFLDILSVSRVLANIFFFGVLTTIVFLSARWVPIV